MGCSTSKLFKIEKLSLVSRPEISLHFYKDKGECRMAERKNKEQKVRVVRRYAEAFKKHVVMEIESGLLSQAEASREYKVPNQSISEWVSKYGTIETQYVEVVMKDQKEKIRELESELANMYIKLQIYEHMMAEMGKDYGFDVKKNTATGELELIDKATGEVLKKHAR